MVDGYDYSLPFFSYGIFKPGQLAYPRIAEYVDSITRGVVDGYLFERNGTAIYVDTPIGSSVGGYLLEPSTPDNAYNEIDAVEPRDQYEVQTLEIETPDQKRPANILVGSMHFSGSEEPTGSRTNREPELHTSKEFDPFGRVIWWDGSTDILFTEGLGKIERTLNSKPESITPDDPDRLSGEAADHFLDVQMAYLLLWTIIERFLNVRYASGGEADPDDWEKMAAKEAFQSTLMDVVKPDRQGATLLGLRSARQVYKLDRQEPTEAIGYYRRLRNNVAHRGKGAGATEYEALYKSCRELSKCFQAELKATFEESRKHVEQEVNGA